MPIALKSDSNTSLQDFDSIRALVEDDLTAVDAVMVMQAKNRAGLIPMITRHLMNAGGKRIRPLLTLLSARMCGHRGTRHIGLASSVEYIHTATLLHDDVIDESNVRRGSATANNRWGNKASILVGDFLFSQAFRLMVADGSIEVLDLLSKTSAVISEGEVKQLALSHDLNMTEKNYLEVITAKTAALFSAACEIGAIVENCSEEKKEALRAYGLNLGIAFQIVDDLLEYSAREEMLGKTIGNDFKEGKITLPVIFAFKKAASSEKPFFERVFTSRHQKNDDFYHMLGLLNGYSSLDDAMIVANDYAQKAIQALDCFEDDSIEKEALLRLVAFTIERDY